VFAEHVVHVAFDVAPTTLLAVPAVQFVQVPFVAPPQLLRYVPAVQFDVHCEQIVEFARLYVPLAQPVQLPAEARPQPSRKSPAAQAAAEHCVHARALAAL
jgi:hypothetical protein